jgi:hypothetical protein
MRVIPVRILRDASSGGIMYDPPRFHVCKKHEDEVEWSCDWSGFTVDFGKTTDSPFQAAKFESKSPGSVRSGRVRPEVESVGDARLYPYKVTMVSGAAADPEGQVDP